MGVTHVYTEVNRDTTENIKVNRLFLSLYIGSVFYVFFIFVNTCFVSLLVCIAEF